MIKALHALGIDLVARSRRDRRQRRNGYELLFFNASLSISEKIEKWRAVGKSLQVVTNVLMLSLLAVGVMSMH